MFIISFYFIAVIKRQRKMDGEKEQYALNLLKSYASTQTF